MKIPAKAADISQTGAFTFVELLAIVAVIALLATLLSPALASTKGRTQLASCANNLKELGMGSLVYAQNYDGRYPITQVGNQNGAIQGGFYTRWIFFDGARPNFHLSMTWDAGTAPDDPDAGGGPKTGTFWRNFGMLYPEKLAGDGSMFYCPALSTKNSIMGSAGYQPLLTTSGPVGDSNPGSVRGCYIYNPWVDGSNKRLYEKTSDVKGRKVFGLDFIGSTIWNANGTINTDSTELAHSRERGWNVLFTDGSVEFKRADFRETQVYLTNPGLFNTPDDIKGINLLSQLIFER